MSIELWVLRKKSGKIFGFSRPKQGKSIFFLSPRRQEELISILIACYSFFLLFFTPLREIPPL